MSYTARRSIAASGGASPQHKAVLRLCIVRCFACAQVTCSLSRMFLGWETLHEFYMQDWGDKIRVFFGVPSSWEEASFVNLRANGAFLISATRKAGRNTLIQVESEKGGVCRLQTGMPVENLQVLSLTGKARMFTVVSEQDGTIEMRMAAGEVVQVMDKSRQTGRK